ELGLDIQPIIDHFSEHASAESIQSIVDEAMQLGVSQVQFTPFPDEPEPVAAAAAPQPVPKRRG
ncbi:MAG: hypothetical protein AB7V46_12670, partial [Thermomicrobiales bacterium]